MSRDFAPVAPAVWGSRSFLSLDSDGRQLMLFFICGPHQNSAGCCRIREGYVLADLIWEPAQYRRALANVVAADLVAHDPATEETYVKKWFQHKGNIPTNKDHAKGTMIIEHIDSDEIREIVEADFMATEWAKRTFDPDQPDQPTNVIGGDRLANTRLMRGGGGRL
ncbi:hypothetical protein [Mesorhizobium sp. L103C105A0]|uniref:hypothetical protein n=1 Tax=Mesorhizobium sp. L103C105A0 TaxID=1287074 RepID=UPI0003D04339|nr:hypothetical protein [Mesorhizobium sp. L103C105A0]ESZ77610.1 hypothetical protein X726_06410 [Mesorhizobium sp. L103C105A0]